VAGNFTSRAHSALNAGCDMVLVCNHSEAAQEVLESLEDFSSPASQMRLVRMHGRGGISRQQLLQSERWQSIVKKIELLDDDPNMQLSV